MAKVTGTLDRGIRQGETTHKFFQLRSLRAGDIIDAQADSEKPVLTPDGYQLVSSPALMGAELLRRQVVKLGSLEGPLELFILKKLSSRDLEILNQHAERLDAATLAEVASRGRDVGNSTKPEKSAASDISASALDETRPD